MIPKFVKFELLLHAAFVADEVWGFMLEPARSISEDLQKVHIIELQRKRDSRETPWYDR